MSDQVEAVCSHEFARRVWPARPEQLPTIAAELARWVDPGAAPEGTGGDGASQRGGDERRHGLVAAAVEAVENAIQHAYPAAPGTVEIRFWVEAHIAYLEIIDTGQWRSEESAQVGRGVDLMRHLVEAVLIRQGRAGTRVLVCQPLTAPTGTRPEPPQVPYPRSPAHHSPVDHRGQQQHSCEPLLDATATDPDRAPLAPTAVA
jgi:Histidine kinase-like ATPase domain